MTGRLPFFCEEVVDLAHTPIRHWILAITLPLVVPLYFAKRG